MIYILLAIVLSGCSGIEKVVEVGGAALENSNRKVAKDEDEHIIREITQSEKRIDIHDLFFKQLINNEDRIIDDVDRLEKKVDQQLLNDEEMKLSISDIKSRVKKNRLLINRYKSSQEKKIRQIENRISVIEEKYRGKQK